MFKMYETTGRATIEEIDKPHILVYRELGSRILSIKGFDTLTELRDFINSPNIIDVVKRFEEGK